MIQKTDMRYWFIFCLCTFPSCSKTSEPKNDPIKDVVYTSMLPAGWYAQDKDELNNQLESYLDMAQKNFNVVVDPTTVRAIIAPHAGLFYSGLCSATAYQTLLQRKSGKTYDEQKNTHISRVIVIAPSHAAFLHHVSLPDFTIYKTVLGDIPIDCDAIKKLKLKKNMFTVFQEVYTKEHALEIQLPFLQKTIAQFELVPLIVGHIQPYDIYEIVASLKEIIDDKTLIVISSDFTHHGQNYGYQVFLTNLLDQVRLVDSLVVRAINSQTPEVFNEILKQTQATVCGADAIRILLALMEVNILNDLESRLTCYYTSPQLDKARPKMNEKIIPDKLFDEIADAEANNSVSYVGMIFTTEKDVSLPLIDRLTGYEKKALLRVARRTIANEFLPEDKKKPDAQLFPIISAGLESSSGAFVTLNKKNGELRGCIGKIVTQEPLFITVQAMSKSAAFEDNRFSPLVQAELENIVIDISILEPPVNISSWKDIVIGKHGVILSKGGASAVFLPQVAPEQHWDVPTMLQHLSLKAGLASDAWKEGASFQVFEGCEIKEK